MAKFVGTVREFHNLLGPRIRDVVNTMAQRHRDRHGGICEWCGAKAESRSVHVHTRDLRTRIDAVLSDYMDEVGFVICDLDEAEVRIIEAHMPEEDTFMCLCHACRVAHDAGGSRTSGVGCKSTATREAASLRAPSGDGEFHKLRRIKLWASRPQQINHRIIRGFLALEHDGGVEYRDLQRYCEDELGVPTFYPAFAQMKTDAANAHGKVFYVKGTQVRMWSQARAEVDKYFGGSPRPETASPEVPSRLAAQCPVRRALATEGDFRGVRTDPTGAVAAGIRGAECDRVGRPQVRK